MGSSSTTADDLAARAAYRAATGTSYAYSATMHAVPFHDRKIHESLDPKRLNTLGKQIRECFDSIEHPLTVPVVFGFDQTGSMGNGPRIIQEKLSTLKGLTLRAGMPDVQLCFGAYGDAQNHEIAPCQVGQFESGLEMEDWLNNLFLEGNGGGNGGETAGLFLYFLANYTDLDSVNKRGKKGYVFLTGDEIALPVTRAELKTYIDEDSETDYTIQQVIEMVTKKFEVFFFLVENGAARAQGSLKFWSDLLGNDHVIVVEDLNNISELAATLLANEEGMITSIDHATDLLKAEGAAGTAIEVVSKTLAHRGVASTTASVATTTGGTLAATTAADTTDL